MTPRFSEPDEPDLSAASALFHGLGDTTRLRILQHLMLGEHRVVELTGHLGLAQSTVSAHVSRLRDAGLIEARHQGRSTYYRLAFAPATARLLLAAEELLGHTGDAVILCPTHPEHDGEPAAPVGPASEVS